MKNLLKLFLGVSGSILICYNAQGQSELKPQRTVIAGVVTNFSDDTGVLIVNYCDPLSEESKFAQNLTESNGHFHTEHDYGFAQDISIRLGNRYIQLFVHPGDSVFVAVDASRIKNEFADAIRFSGDNAGLNAELHAWKNVSDGVIKRNFEWLDLQAAPADLLANLERDLNRVRDSIEAYSQRTGMSDFLKQWAFLDYKFHVANYLIPYKHPETDRWKFLTDPLLDTFNDTNFQASIFQFHLSACRVALIMSNLLGVSLKPNEYKATIRGIIVKFLEEAPVGIVRDVMLFDFLWSKLDGMQELLDSVPDVRASFSQDFFRIETEKRLEKSTMQMLPLPESERPLTGILYLSDDKTEALPDVPLLNYFREKYKDKVVYIDVWATWCGPCLAEFKSAPFLHEYFEGKDVVFVNLCLESAVENWKQTIIDQDIEGENYFLDSNASRLFCADHNISGFPAYILMDRDGKILNPAPRPSGSRTLIETIESCLK